MLNSEHANTLYNYGVLLDSHLLKKADAEAMYRRAITVSPKHPFALYNIAVLLEEDLSKLRPEAGTKYEDLKTEVCNFYMRATDASPGDPTTVADFGRFLLTYTDEQKKGENCLHSAIKLDSKCIVALFQLGLLYYDQKKKNDIGSAEDYFRRAIFSHPNHVGSMQHLVKVLKDARRPPPRTNGGKKEKFGVMDLETVEEVLDLLEKLVSIDKSPADVLLEYSNIAAEQGSAKQKLRAMTFMQKNSAALSGLVPGLDFLDKIQEKLKVAAK